MSNNNWKQMRYLMWLQIGLLVIIALNGCAAPQAPYAQAFVGYRLSDGGFQSCSDENSGIRVGYEWSVSESWNIAAEYEHVSHLLCGKPFHGRGGTHKEDFTDHVGVVFTYGGIK